MTISDNINMISGRDPILAEMERCMRGRAVELEQKYGKRTCPQCERTSSGGQYHEIMCPVVVQQ